MALKDTEVCDFGFPKNALISHPIELLGYFWSHDHILYILCTGIQCYKQSNNKLALVTLSYKTRNSKRIRSIFPHPLYFGNPI